MLFVLFVLFVLFALFVLFVLFVMAVLFFTSVLFAFYSSLTHPDVSDAAASALRAQPWKTLERGN